MEQSTPQCFGSAVIYNTFVQKNVQSFNLTICPSSVLFSSCPNMNFGSAQFFGLCGTWLPIERLAFLVSFFFSAVCFSMYECVCTASYFGIICTHSFLCHRPTLIAFYCPSRTNCFVELHSILGQVKH